eukprot:3489992-Pyramimonas_sp.AAC.1
MAASYRRLPPANRPYFALELVGGSTQPSFCAVSVRASAIHVPAANPPSCQRSIIHSHDAVNCHVLS